jgi:hypothetical protein
MLILNTRNYFSLSDMFAIANGAPVDWSKITNSDDNLAVVYNLLNGSPFPAEILSVTSDSYAEKMFARFIRRCWEDSIVFTDDYFENDIEVSPDPKPSFISWCERSASFFERTLSREKAILLAYDAKIASLSSPIHAQNKTTTKQNEMPVSEIDTENHLSNLDDVTTTSDEDGATPIARLAEIQNLWNDEMTKWENDFIAIFIVPDL